MTDCAVRRLRVAADDESAARRFVTTLEDALRCATLPDDDRRVVVVRRLALGRVAHDAGTQRLGRLIEERLARGDIAWASVGASPDPRAAAIGFAGALEARVHLARRLADAAPCDAWYWPLAVPEFRPDLAPRETLRRMAQAIAAWPEARVALPAWLAQVVRAGGAGALVSAIDEARGLALLRAAGIDVPGATREAAVSSPPSLAPTETTTSARASERSPDAVPQPALPARSSLSRPSGHEWPQWLRIALERGGVVADSAAARADFAPATPRADPPTGAPHPTPSDVAAPRTASASATAATAAIQDAETSTRACATSIAPSTSPHEPASHAAARASTAPPLHDGDWRPTGCGGLLFLLPVLARAGLVQRDDPDAARLDALRVLLLALRRVRAEPHDPAWALVADLPPLPPVQARDAQARAARGFAAARRWLHRHARLGVVALVRRPAVIALTATHIDVRFPLAGADVRVRRLGLDANPGWLPWFGRVIAFQFAGRQP